MKETLTDLLATNRIVSLLEATKNLGDSITDHLPGVFAFIDSDGSILRGNIGLAEILNVDLEKLVEKKFSEIFENDSWSAFRLWLDQLRPGRDVMEFELAIDRADRTSVPYLWELARIEVSSKSANKVYFRVVGRDITELRAKERRLSEIYSSLPIGLLTVSSQGVIESLLSEQVASLLDQEHLVGQSVREILFEPGWGKLSDAERKAVTSLLTIFGSDVDEFQVMKGFFPQQIFMPNPTSPHGGKWLGVSYQPLVKNEKVERLFISLEDRTAAVIAKEERDRARAQEEESVRRILEVKRCPSKLAPLMYRELDNFANRINEQFRKGDLRATLNLLHGLKGNARMAGFAHLGGVVHHLESEIGKAKEQTGFELKAFSGSFDQIQNEIYELRRMMIAVHNVQSSNSNDHLARTLQKLYAKFTALSGTARDAGSIVALERADWAIRSTGRTPINEVKDIISSQVESAAKEAKKKASLRWVSEDLKLDSDSRDLLIEALTHLSTNAVAHGIEDPEARKVADKPEVGLVQVSVRDDGTRLHVRFADDGHGIDPVVIKLAALKKGLATQTELAAMDSEQIMQLIFAPGFSTASTVTQLSGRGVGLDAVASAVKRLGGSIQVRSFPGTGSEFLFSFMKSGVRAAQKSFVALADFHKSLEAAVSYQRDEEKLQIEIAKPQGLSQRSGLLLIDRAQSLVAVTNFFGSLSERGAVDVQLDVGERGEVRYIASTAKDRPSLVPNEYEWLRETAESWLKANSGSYAPKAQGAEIYLGRIFTEAELPCVTFHAEEGLDQNAFETTTDLAMELAGILGVQVELPDEHNGRADAIAILIVKGKRPNARQLQIPVGATTGEIKDVIISAIDRILGL